MVHRDILHLQGFSLLEEVNLIGTKCTEFRFQKYFIDCLKHFSAGEGAACTTGSYSLESTYCHLKKEDKNEELWEIFPFPPLTEAAIDDSKNAAEGTDHAGNHLIVSF